VQPQDASAYTVFAQAEDRTGYARATLAPRLGMSAAIPPMDPRPHLTMVDMGKGNMAGMGGMAGMNMGNADTMSAPAGSHHAMGGMSMGDDMPGMNMGMQTAGDNHPLTMPFPQPWPGVRTPSAPAVISNPVPPKAIVLSTGPQVDNVAEDPSNRLGDPGVGLKNNGRRVLTYADLRARYRGVDPRPPSRDIEIHLTGNMERFIWGFDGKKFSAAGPIELKLGERVRFILVNDTMMSHPIHLHGLWSELDNGNGELRPFKHTINVKPGERLSYLVSADTPGRWAYHCHLIYHMEAGMFREVVVS